MAQRVRPRSRSQSWQGLSSSASCAQVESSRWAWSISQASSRCRSSGLQGVKPCVFWKRASFAQ